MTGVFLPLEILKDENLTLQEKIILSMAKNMPDGLYMTNFSLSTLLGVSKGRISHIISSLKSKGYVDVTLIYNENRQVDKRIITIKKVIEKVHEIITQSKNKQLKQEMVQNETKKVEPTRIPYKPKVRDFGMYEHNYDLDKIEILQMQRKSRLVQERGATL